MHLGEAFVPRRARRRPGRPAGPSAVESCPPASARGHLGRVLLWRPRGHLGRVLLRRRRAVTSVVCCPPVKASIHRGQGWPSARRRVAEQGRSLPIARRRAGSRGASGRVRVYSACRASTPTDQPAVLARGRTPRAPTQATSPARRWRALRDTAGRHRRTPTSSRRCARPIAATGSEHSVAGCRHAVVEISRSGDSDDRRVEKVHVGSVALPQPSSARSPAPPMYLRPVVGRPTVNP
jgi:hypothetical protein